MVKSLTKKIDFLPGKEELEGKCANFNPALLDGPLPWRKDEMGIAFKMVSRE